MLVMLGVEWWAEPMEAPEDRTSVQQYDVDDQVLAKWREARKEYLQARAALLREIGRQGFRAPLRPSEDVEEAMFEEQFAEEVGGYVYIVFTGPPGPEAPRFVDVEDDQGRSIRYGEWVQRPDGYWALRIPTGGDEG